MKGKIERRFIKSEIRAKAEGHIDGHMAVFDQEYVLWDSDSYRVVETVLPTAFDRALKEKHDVRCCFNHDSNQLLGRTSAGTMELKKDDTGLYFDTTLPDTQLARDLSVLIGRGDINGASFAFTVTAETIREEKVKDKIICTRQIEDVDLYEGGPVTWPAYTGTDVSAREMRTAMFPAGVPERILQLVPELRDGAAPPATTARDTEECQCLCEACKDGRCEDCSETDCQDANCKHSDRAAVLLEIDTRMRLAGMRPAGMRPLPA
jgi:HK97 family phage prohead protease